MHPELNKNLSELERTLLTRIIELENALRQAQHALYLLDTFGSIHNSMYKWQKDLMTTELYLAYEARIYCWCACGPDGLPAEHGINCPEHGKLKGDNNATETK